MSETGRGIATGLGFCAAAAIACSEDWSTGVAAVKGLVLLLIAVLSFAMVGSMVAKPK